MSNHSIRLSLLVLLGLLLTTLTACGGSNRGSEDGDDDDSAADDDDDAADDDDAVGDDDDVLGDDDDASSDDDDDATGDDDDATQPVELPYTTLGFQLELDVVQAGGGNYGLGGIYTFVYYETYDQQTGNMVEFCRERIEIEAVASFGAGQVPGCDNCTGRILVEESFVDNVSNPLLEPTDCDPSWINADDNGDGFPDYSLGWAFVASAANNGYGDFLDLGLIDYNTFESLGLTGDAAGANDAATLSAPWAGMAVTHFGYVNAGPSSFSATSGLSGVAAPAGPGSDYYWYWTIAKDPNINSHMGTDMVGAYVGSAGWIITFQ